MYITMLLENVSVHYTPSVTFHAFAVGRENTADIRLILHTSLGKSGTHMILHGMGGRRKHIYLLYMTHKLICISPKLICNIYSMGIAQPLES